MWYPRFIKQMRCDHEWSEPFILKYEKTHHRLFDNGMGGADKVSAEFCRKCGKWAAYRCIHSLEEHREKRITIKEFHQMRREACRQRSRREGQ